MPSQTAASVHPSLFSVRIVVINVTDKTRCEVQPAANEKQRRRAPGVLRETGADLALKDVQPFITF